MIFLLLSGCRQDYDYVNYESETKTLQAPDLNIATSGLYILNEGNMGSNKASLDFFNYETGVFTKNYYVQQNPTVVNSLGDVGNDIKIYKDRLYAVINLSNQVEVMEAKTAKHIGSINIPNCRYITFDENYAYVTSYAGAVVINPNYAQLGYVAKVNLSTLKIEAKTNVGFQPDELEIANGKIYVANSGGYMFPNYERTISVIDLNSFQEIKKIDVEINLSRIKKDKNGKLWVTSRGDLKNIPPNTYIIDPQTDTVIKKLNVVISDMAFYGDKVYYYGYSWNSSETATTYGVFDVNSYEKTADNFMQDNVQQQIRIPYGITVNPVNGDIFLADAKNYVSPGELFCFENSGKLKWKTTTGDIPGHFAWLFK